MTVNDLGGPVLSATSQVDSSPIVVINTAHSGSRLLAAALIEAGVYMGSNLNESLDCLDMEPLVRSAVMTACGPVPGRDEFHNAELRRIAEACFASHLERLPPGHRWGWKLCETLVIAPLIDHYFPEARFVHLIRDGRDVALSPFVSPKHSYWRKIYFGRADITAWRGFPMTQRAYRARGTLFNAHRWRYHVDLARRFGQTLGHRYIEVRYEDLVRDYDRVTGRLGDQLGLTSGPAKAAGPRPYPTSIDKWRKRPSREIAELSALLEPTLSSLGYDQPGSVAAAPRASAVEKILYRRYF